MTVTETHSTAEQKGVVGRLVFLGLIGLLVFGVTVSAGIFVLDSLKSNSQPLRPLDKFTLVPEFTLSERMGGVLTREDLFGKVWIANFIYTSCSSTCPMMTSRIRFLQESLPQKDDIRFVSFSVDPKRDTIQRLDEYARNHRADEGRWYFVTGKDGEVEELARTGFKLPSARSAEDIAHSTRFVLVDGQSFVRGYYEGIHTGSVDPLIRDVQRLLSESRD